MARRLLRFAPALLLIGVAVAFFATGAERDLTLAGLAAHARAWRMAAAHDPVLTLGVYMGVYAVLAAAALPVAMILTIAGGLLFGPVWGAVAAIVAANVAALIGYAAARSALGAVIARWLEGRNDAAGRLVGDLAARGFWPILAARLMPVMPFAAVNVAAGLARTRLATYVAATLLGGLPSAFIGAALGAGLGAHLSAASLGQAVRSPMVWGPLLALSAVSALPALLARRRPARA